MGAIFTLLRMYIYEDVFSVVRSIKLGQPKVTNDHGVGMYGFLPLTRVVDENDLVPMVPPITLLDSIHGCYEHFGDEVIFSKHLLVRFPKEDEIAELLIKVHTGK